MKNEKQHPAPGRDYLVRMSAAESTVIAFAAATKELSEEARIAHDTTPVATAALGRLLTAGAMMGALLKDDQDLLTLSIRGDGPLAGITVTADHNGKVKGFVSNPSVDIPPKASGKLDVGGAVGNGTLTVTRDQAYGQPYSSQVALTTGEIGDDLAAYFALSEQIPSTVGLGVLVDRDLTVRCAGGFLIQLMPGHSEETIDILEKNLSGFPGVTAFLNQGGTPEEMLSLLLEGLSPTPEQTMPLQFYCNCDRDRVQRVLLSLSRKDLDSLIEAGEDTELKCHFCGRRYLFTPQELRTLRDAAG